MADYSNWGRVEGDNRGLLEIRRPDRAATSYKCEICGFATTVTDKVMREASEMTAVLAAVRSSHSRYHSGWVDRQREKEKALNPVRIMTADSTYTVSVNSWSGQAARTTMSNAIYTTYGTEASSVPWNRSEAVIPLAGALAEKMARMRDQDILGLLKEANKQPEPVYEHPTTTADGEPILRPRRVAN